MPPLGRKSRNAALRIAEYWPRRAFNAAGTSGGPSNTKWPSWRPPRPGGVTAGIGKAGAGFAATTVRFLTAARFVTVFFFFFFLTTFDFEDAASAVPDPFHAGTDTNETMQAISSRDKKRFKLKLSLVWGRKGRGRTAPDANESIA